MRTRISFLLIVCGLMLAAVAAPAGAVSGGKKWGAMSQVHARTIGVAYRELHIHVFVF
jgi:hypothetical protein